MTPPDEFHRRRRKNVFVLGLDDVHLRQLESLRRADEYRFHELCSKTEVKSFEPDVVERTLTSAREVLASFDGPIDAVVGYWDFPVSTMLPILRGEHDLPTPSLESVLRCEHKYWSRIEQRRCIPSFVPDFCLVDPFADDVASQITIEYPFWIKPVRSLKSYLGFRVESPDDLADAIGRIRSGIDTIAVPFVDLLQHAELPDDIAPIDGRHCIAESLISAGQQCTLEGYAHDGEVVVYGAVDSIREGPYRSSLARYQYPSMLPDAVLASMAEAARTFISHIGFTPSPFNIEFFWDETTDDTWLLEVNARLSKSHAPLFEHVDGEYHHQVMLDVALGEDPHPPHRLGRHPLAAKFMWRSHDDAIVRHVPTGDELDELRHRFPDAEIEFDVREGDRLADLPSQDSYSYELATIFLGDDDEQSMIDDYERIQAAAHLELEPLPNDTELDEEVAP